MIINVKLNVHEECVFKLYCKCTLFYQQGNETKKWTLEMYIMKRHGLPIIMLILV